MFSPSQADVRRFFCAVYDKQRLQQPMEAIEMIAAQWMAEHPEHHADFADVDAALAAMGQPDADKTKLIGASAQITGARTGVAELEVKAGSAEADAKTKLISSATQILSARANVADTQVKAAVANAEVKTRLMAGAAQIFDSRIRSAQAVSDVAKHNNTVAFDASVKNQMSDLTLIEDKLKAMLAEAQSIAQVCAAFVNNLHVSASLAANGGTTISQSNEF